MDKKLLLEICQPFKKVEINGQSFYLRRLSPPQFALLRDKYFSQNEDTTPVDTETTPEEKAKLPRALRDKLDSLGEFELDVLTYSLCDENGEVLFTIEERETVRIFDPAYLQELKAKAYEHSYGYFLKQAVTEQKATAKKKKSKKIRSSGFSSDGPTTDDKPSKS